MAWPINEVAEKSGTTSRALRHYDAIGLLCPAFTAAGGRRYYEQEQLLKLQRILLLRELGLSLERIAEVLSSGDDGRTVEALQDHCEWLRRERKRLARLIKTVENTMSTLEEGKKMKPTEMFDGFERDPYEAEARERWGDQAIDDSYARMRSWSQGWAEQAKSGFGEIMAVLAEQRDAGKQVDGVEVQRVIAGHYEWTCLFWTPDRESYANLADMYWEDGRFRENIGKGHDELVAYLRDAMKFYAEKSLG